MIRRQAKKGFDGYDDKLQETKAKLSKASMEGTNFFPREWRQHAGRLQGDPLVELSGEQLVSVTARQLKGC